MSDNNSIYHCGCCEDTNLLMPEDTSNLPGLSVLGYRVGTHFSFRQSMLEAIVKYAGLNRLTTRYDDDFAIATLDAWATVLDVLTFYQERIINEGYLRTATERLSIVELARHISYRLKPGVAASTFLAFSMNEAPGAPLSASIPVGTKVQSVPEQGQLPQVFETTEQINARVEWNNIKLQTQRKFIPSFDGGEIYLQGILTGLQPGDGVLMIGDERKNSLTNENWDFRKVREVIPDKDLDITKITWSKGLGKLTGSGVKINPAAANVKIYALRQKASLFGYNAPDFRILADAVKNQFFPSTLLGQYFNGKSFDQFVLSRTDASINFNWGTGSPDPKIGNDNFSVRWTAGLIAPVSGVYTFFTNSDDGVRLWVNGALIIDNWTVHGLTENSATTSLTEGQFCSILLEYFEQGGAAVITLSWAGPGFAKQIIPADRFLINDWPGYNVAAVSQAVDTIYLDNTYPKIVKDSWLVISTANYEEVYKADEVKESARKAFTLGSKSSAIKLSGENLIEKFNTSIREAIVYAQSEELPIAFKPVDDAIINYQQLTLAALMPGLYSGQHIVISGKRMRIRITESTHQLQFTVADNSIASRVLKAGDELVLVQKPENISPAKKKFVLFDSGGFTGTIEAMTNDYKIIPSKKDDATVSELHIINYLVEGVNPTTIVLKDLLINSFDAATVAINANVVLSTHGETKQETLGSGNTAEAFQKFVLKQNPLTYVSDAGPTGAKTTLQVRVNDILWKEVPSLYGISPKEKVYTTTIADDEKVTVQFGDGITGARLPGGAGNISANYRVGIGYDGFLHAGQLSMLMSPQLGVNKVTNLLDTSGADDPETLDTARTNAPLTVLTLDRIVSIQDFEDFVRGFAGIGKAIAQALWNGEQQEVYITIAGANGNTVSNNPDLLVRLTSAIQHSGHTYSRVTLLSYTPAQFSINARIQTDAAYIFDKVKEQVIAALRKEFSFQTRAFGQDVTLAEIMNTIQAVEGVVYVDVEALNGADPFGNTGVQRIVSNLAIRQGNMVLPAELLTISDIFINQIA